MDRKRTLNNFVLIKLDKENDSIKTASGFTLYVDTSFEKEKHATVTGEVWGLPSRLEYTGKANKGMGWRTDMEIQYGDRVIVYYLAIINALTPSNQRYFMEGEDRYVFVPYSSIFTVIRDGEIIPVNGYVLIEPCGDPFQEAVIKRLRLLNIELISHKDKSNTDVSFGIVRYLGKPNREYVDAGMSDDGVDIAVGDKVVLRRISDIPLQYD